MMLADRMNRIGRVATWCVAGALVFAAWCGLMYLGLWALVVLLRSVGANI